MIWGPTAQSYAAWVARWRVATHVRLSTMSERELRREARQRLDANEHDRIPARFARAELRRREALER